MAAVIRRAAVADAAAIATVQVRTWQVAYRGQLPQAYLDALTPEQRESALAERAEKMSAWTAGVLRKAIEKWERPKQIESSAAGEIRVQIDGEGEILDWEWVKPTGVKAMDKSIVRSFKNAEPFDPPPDTGAAFIGVVFAFPAQDGSAKHKPN